MRGSSRSGANFQHSHNSRLNAAPKTLDPITGGSFRDIVVFAEATCGPKRPQRGQLIEVKCAGAPVVVPISPFE